MAAGTILKGSEMFVDGCPVIVMDAEHHGKVSMHSHDFYEAVLIDKGFALHTMNGNLSVLTAGDFFIIRPDQKHAYLSAHNAGLYNCLFEIARLGDLQDEILRLKAFHRLTTGPGDDFQKLHLDPYEKREIQIYLDAMKTERVNRQAGWRLKTKSLLAGMLVQYSRFFERWYNEKREAIHSLYALKALAYIEDHGDQEIGVKEIAEHIGISPDYMTRHFKRAVGLTPMDYIIHYRVARTMEKLRTTDAPIAQVACESGFSDISHYSHQFKKVTGLTPTAFRKQDNE